MAKSKITGARTRVLRVVVDEKEKQQITKNAAALKMSVSSYLRWLGCGQPLSPSS